MKLRDLSVGVLVFSGARPVDWVMFSSGVSAIAHADVTKHAKEIPIVRRIGIASFSLSIPRPGQQVSLSHANNMDGCWNEIGVGLVVPDGTRHGR